jgi:hypothetical protein
MELREDMKGVQLLIIFEGGDSHPMDNPTRRSNAPRPSILHGEEPSGRVVEQVFS